MKIGELAKIVDLNVETLRYYERLEILENPQRTSSGYRNYDQDAINRIRFIQNSQQLGFSLTEIKLLIDLTKSQSGTKNIDNNLLLKVNRLESKLNELMHFKDSILELVASD